MKYPRFYTVLIILTASSLACKAQCPSNKGQLEVAVSQGFITSDQISDQVAANENASSGSGGKTQTYNSGATFVTIRYFLYNRIALGFTGGITNERGQYTDKYTPSMITSTYTQSITTIAPELYYIYFFRKYFEVYSLLGIGPAFTSITTTVNPTPYTARSVTTSGSDVIKLQYTPIGIHIGGRIGGFAELGIGYKGTINVGASFKFGPTCWWRM